MFVQSNSTDKKIQIYCVSWNFAAAGMCGWEIRGCWSQLLGYKEDYNHHAAVPVLKQNVINVCLTFQMVGAIGQQMDVKLIIPQAMRQPFQLNANATT